MLSPPSAAPPSTEVEPDPIEYELQARAAEARALLIDLCRRDVNAFCEYVLRDEETGEQIEQLDFHVQLQQALTDHRQIVGLAHPESGKTNQIAIGRVLWELGRNPNMRVMLVGNTQEGARKSLSSIKKYIEKSEELHEVFPHLTRGDLWQDVAITVNRPVYSKDPSVQAVGYMGGQILGSRVDFLVVDDLLNMEVTSTEAQRRKVSTWFRSTLLGRCTKSALVAFLTNAWHPRDLSHELHRERGWFRIMRPIRVDGVSVWPSRWPEERIKKREKDLGSLEFARVFMCQPRDEGDMIFKAHFFEVCRPPKKPLVHPVRELDVVPDGCVVVCGVDIGGRRTAGANSSIATLLLHPNGTRQPLWLESGRWGATELLNRIVDNGQRYKGIVAVENNGVQLHLVDLAIENSKAVVPIVPYQTGNNKVDPRFGVASMSSEFEGGRWILPTQASNLLERNALNELEEWIIEMLDYTPEQHTGDRLMAFWIAREVARRWHAVLYGDGGSARKVQAQVLG